MIEPGSFRDPESRVFYHEGRVLRALTEAAAQDDAAARSSGAMTRLVDRGWFIPNWPVDDVEPPQGLPGTVVIESDRVPIITYPAEWSFAMLKTAALITLDANLLALDHGMILKDASAFNVAFDGPRPRIIDVTSLTAFGDKGVWEAYGQFCDQFLAPLMLEAYAGVHFQPRLTGQVAGIPIPELSRMLRGRAAWRKGVPSHVRLRAAIEKRAAGMDTKKRARVGSAALPKAAIRATIAKLRRLVASLQSSAPSVWADYESAVPYEGEGFAAKAEFVSKAATAASAKRVACDIGANAGHFTSLLAEEFDVVVAVDSDPGAIDGLYGRALRTGLNNVFPAVVDVTNQQAAFGWRGQERKGFWERARPDFATWLAVIHHLCLGIGIPLPEVIALVFERSPEAVVEFVAPEDPMARLVAASRSKNLSPYSRDVFESSLARHGRVIAQEQVSPTRTMYHVHRS